MWPRSAVVEGGAGAESVVLDLARVHAQVLAAVCCKA